MPNQPISELNEVTNPSGIDVLAIVNAGETKKVTAANLLSLHTFSSVNSINLVAGTSTDGIADIQTMLDGNVYNLNEVAASPGYDLRFAFINIDNIDHIVVRFYYSGGTSHGCRFQIYNVNTTNWDTLFTESGANVDMSVYTFFMVDDTNYIDGSDQVLVRFYHTEVGNPAHDVFIDYVGIASV